jgi:hypothetical protein
MFKILPIVCLMFTSFSAYTFDLPISEFSTKKIVRAKLWYEGIELAEKSEQSSNQKVIILPEDISIPLELLDS